MVEAFDPHEPFDAPVSYHELYGDHYSGKEFNWPGYARLSRSRRLPYYIFGTVIWPL